MPCKYVSSGFFFLVVKGRDGFSLVDTMLALCVMAIALTVSMPSFSDYIANRELRNATRDIAGDFFELKAMAVSESRIYQIIFRPESNTYTIQRCRYAGSHCESNAFENVATKGMSDFRGNIRIEHAKFGSGSTIRFQTRGTASPGSVRLKNRLASESAVIVNITGRTRLQWMIN
jgi:Tfp pilus assembly protein FimT